MYQISIREAVAAAAVCVVIYKYIIYPAFISPLAKIPNAHFTSSISPFWILWTRYQFRENRNIHKAHERHGPVVRLGPNELSVNCVDDGIRTIYAAGFGKHEFYPNLFPNYNGVPNMFSTVHSKPHATRKRMMSNVYSKSYLQTSTTLSAISRTIIFKRLLPRLEQLISANGGQVEMFKLFNAITMDFVTGYIFGLCNSTNFIEEDDIAEWWLGLYASRKKFVFWPQEMPGTANFFSTFGIRLSPSWVTDANHKLEKHCLELCDAADRTVAEMDSEQESSEPENVPVVYRQLKVSMDSEAAKSLEATPMTPKTPSAIRISVASELLDELSAGEETSAIALTYLFHELSLDQSLQDSLRAEITSTLSPPLRAAPQTNAASALPPLLPDPKAIDALPLLHATLMETLRLHVPIPGSQPRVTPENTNPSGTITIGAHSGIPAGVRVSSQAYSLHRNAAVFPAPESFHPRRWLDADAAARADMHRWFWAFSSGGRMCIGSNLAMQEMKLVAAALVANYRFAVVDDAGMPQEDAYTAQPTGKRLVLRLERV